MPAIDDVVDITISQSTQTVSRRAFGWALVLGSHSVWADRLRWYDQADFSSAMIADGFATTDDIYLAVAAYFAQTPCPTKVAVGRWGAETLSAALAACLQEDADWYGLVLCSKASLDIQSAMSWTESNKRVFVCSHWDTNIIDQTLADDSTSIAAIAKANAYKRSAALYTRGSLYPEAAWIGRCFPNDPGTINWAHKVLAGVTPDTLTSTQRNNAHNKYCSTYETIGGVNVTEEGWTGSGDFLDIRQAIDWLEATLQEEIYSLLVNIDKLPFTDAGIKTVEGTVRRVLQRATDNGVLAPFDADQGDYVSFPAASSISAADKLTRTLNAPKCFQRRLAGALNHIVIRGNITV